MNTTALRAEHQQPASAFRPELAKDDARLDGLPQPDLIRQDHALRQRGLQGKECRLDLVWVQIHSGVEQRHRQAIQPGRAASSQVVGVVLDVVRAITRRAHVQRAVNVGIITRQ